MSVAALPVTHTWRGSPRRWAVFTVGILLLGTGVAISIQASQEVAIGVGSWQVFETGLVATTGMAFGPVVIIESLIALALAMVIFRVRPGPGTVIVAFLVGPLVGVGLDVIGSPTTLVPAVLMFAAGTVMLGVGVGLYISADLGPSAQDALFVGLFSSLPLRPSQARLLLDGALTVGGWLLGGSIGVGTVVVLLVLPPIVEATLALGHRLSGTIPADSKALA